MAEKIKITLEVDESGSIKVVDQLGDKLDDVKKAGEKAADGIESTTKAAKKGESTFSKLGSTIKGAFAIGGVMKILDTLASLFMENQKVVNLLNQAMVVLQGVMNGVIEVLDPLFQGLQKVFKDPLQSVKDFGKALQENIAVRLEGLLEIIPKLGEAIGLLFEGEFSEAAKVATNAVGKVVLGVEDTIAVVEDLGNRAVKAYDTIAKSTKKAFNNREILANASHNIERLGILFQGIVEKYDLMAEQQRQIVTMKPKP
jgi:methyl-accepting chemotaxis protein